MKNSKNSVKNFMDNIDKWKSFLGLLGISMKAGKLHIGDGKAADIIRSDKADLIILASDASENTVKRFLNMGKFRNVKTVSACDRYMLGNALGKSFAVVIAVSDKSLSNELVKRLP